MAQQNKKLTENAEGPFFVDTTCIDCDACRWLAPENFARGREQSFVKRQPETQAETEKVWRALTACPTASIGAVGLPRPAGFKDLFPVHVHGPVYHCGYHAASSHGAASYLIRHPKGNIMVDSPRFSRTLVNKIKEWGGVRTLFLTHVDDVADHEKYAREFSCARIMHREDVSHDLRGIEIQVEQERYELHDNAILHHVPGHTPGHMVLQLDEKYLFTGDHLAWSGDRGHLVAFRDYCWHSWEEQTASMEKTALLKFEWIMPGHGRMFQAGPERMHQEMSNLIRWMKSGMGRDNMHG